MITSENREKHTGRKKLGGVILLTLPADPPGDLPPAWWGAPGTKETLGLKNLRVPIGLEGVQTHHEGQDSGKGFKAIVGYQNGLE